MPPRAPRGAPRVRQLQPKRKPRVKSISSLEQWEKALDLSEQELLIVLYYSSKVSSGAAMLRFLRDLSAEKGLQHMFFVSVDVEEDETEAIGKQQQIFVLPTVDVWLQRQRAERQEGGDPTKVIELIDRHAQKAKQKKQSESCRSTLKLAAPLLLAAAALSFLSSVLVRRKRAASDPQNVRNPWVNQARHISAV